MEPDEFDSCGTKRLHFQELKLQLMEPKFKANQSQANFERLSEKREDSRKSAAKSIHPTQPTADVGKHVFDANLPEKKVHRIPAHVSELTKKLGDSEISGCHQDSRRKPAICSIIIPSITGDEWLIPQVAKQPKRPPHKKQRDADIRTSIARYSMGNSQIPTSLIKEIIRRPYSVHCRPSLDERSPFDKPTTANCLKRRISTPSVLPQTASGLTGNFLDYSASKVKIYESKPIKKSVSVSLPLLYKPLTAKSTKKSMSQECILT